MKTVAVPQRTLDQRMEALWIANDIRVKRAALKNSIRAGNVLASSVILEVPQYAQTMKLHDLLLAIPKVGTTKVARLLRDLRISHSKTLIGLSERQCVEVVSYLERTGT